MALSLDKKTELVRLNLEKRKVPTDIKMAVKLCTDVSGSIQPYFSNGTMQELVDRLIPVAIRFDDNGSLDSYAFGSDAAKLPDIKESDFGSYINKKFLDEVPARILWSGTQYSNALELISKDIGESKAGFFGGMFGKKKPVLKPTYLMFTTDGETNDDESETEDLIQDLSDKKTYIQLIGIGRANFKFLELMARRYDHVGFVTFPKLETTSDEAMYEALLGEELCNWIKAQ